MPDYYNNILVVKYEELVPYYWNSENSLSKACRRSEKKGYGLKRISIGGNGREALIVFDSLPQYIQDSIGDPRKDLHILEKFYETDLQAVDFYQNYRFDDGTRLKEHVVDKYVANASVLNAAIQLKAAREYEIASKGFKPKKIFQSLTADVVSFNDVLLSKYSLQHNLPKNYLRFKELYQKYLITGYPQLISKRHKNKNSRKVTGIVEQLLNDIFTTKKPNQYEVFAQYSDFLKGYNEVINTETGEIYNPAIFPEVSETTVRNYLKKWENRAITHGLRSGNRQVYMNQYRGFISNERTIYSNSIISIDDRNPPFYYNEAGKRVWVYMAYDDGSEAFTAIVDSDTKGGLIIDFYRELVRNYTEWGVNFPLGLECESSLNSNFKDKFLQPGKMFKDVRIESNNARGKIIERKFRDLRYGPEKKQSSWLGRVAPRLESNQFMPHQEGKSAKDLMRPYKEIVEFVHEEIEEWNNSPHSQYPEMTRWEYFLNQQHPDSRPINWRGVLPWLGYKTETSVKVGQLRLQGSFWLLGEDSKIVTGDRLIELYKQAEGEKVTVYWLDDHDGNVIKALIYKGDQYICEALPKPLSTRAKAEQTPQHKANFELVTRYITTIDGYIKRGKQEVNKLVIEDLKPKTLNNKFKIRGANTEREIQSHIEQDILEDREVKVLADLPDEDYNYDYNSNNSNLEDRF